VPLNNRFTALDRYHDSAVRRDFRLGGIGRCILPAIESFAALKVNSEATRVAALLQDDRSALRQGLAASSAAIAGNQKACGQLPLH
jgi:hypothetical protein